MCSRANYTLIAGSIPPEIGNLRALKILNVQNNSLHGEWRTQIIRSNHGVSLRCRKGKKGLASGKAKGRHQRCCKCTQLLCVPGALKGKGKYKYSDVVVVGNSREFSRKYFQEIAPGRPRGAAGPSHPIRSRRTLSARFCHGFAPI